MDSEKVKLIKAAIADGTYEVNPANVANKLLELENGLANELDRQANNNDRGQSTGD